MKKIIVVTGASSGMGKEFVYQITKKIKVQEVWLLARRKDKLKEIAEQLSVKTKIIAIDLSTQEGLNFYQKKLEKEKPSICILANCAGFGKLNHYENESLETNLNMIDLNIKGTVSMVNYSLPYMRQGSKIMNLVSCSAFQPLPYINIYASTKSFLLSYSRALNRELSYRKIHVLAVCPFWVRTEFFDRAIDPNEKRAVIHYGAIYGPEAVIRKAIKDLFSKKDVSAYGLLNKLQILSVKLVPHKYVMNLWMLQQKLDGTPSIRK